MRKKVEDENQQLQAPNGNMHCAHVHASVWEQAYKLATRELSRLGCLIHYKKLRPAWAY